MKTCRKLTALSILLLLCVAFCSLTVFAADERLGEIVDGSVLTEDTEVQSSSQPLARGTFLNYGSGTLTKDGNSKVTISAQTVCYVTCDQVKVTLFLQRLVGNSWVTVNTLGPKVAYNTYYVSATNSYSVTGGYYYRLKTSHVAIDDGANEATTSFTNGIWID